VAGVNFDVFVHFKKAAQAREHSGFVAAGKVRAAVGVVKEGVPGKKHSLFSVPERGAARRMTGEVKYSKGAYFGAFFKENVRGRQIVPKGVDKRAGAHSGFNAYGVDFVRVRAEVFRVQMVNGYLRFWV